MTAILIGRRREVLGALIMVVTNLAVAHAQVVPAPRGAASACGVPFKPSGRLPGTLTTIPNTSIRLTLPRGWSGQPALKPDGTPYYQVFAPPAGPGGQVALAATNGAGNQPIAQLLGETARAIAQPQLATFGTPRLFSLGQDCGGQLIFRGPGVEGYVALVRSGEWVYAVVAKYPAPSAPAMRAGLDTIVATVKLAPLRSPVAARAELPGAAGPQPGPESVVGCWERAPDAHTMQRIQLRANGTYNWFRAITGFQYNVEPEEEEGRYRLAGNTLILTSSQGQTETYGVSVSNGALTMGNARYGACD